MPRLDVDAINAEAGPRLGILLERLGSPKVTGRPDSGRAVCPLCRTDGKLDLDLAFSNGRIKCHRCDFGGDAIRLVEAHSGLSFRDAAERLGEILGLRVEEADRSRDTYPVRLRASAPIAAAPAASKRDAEALWNRFAKSDPDGEAYLRGRGLLTDTVPNRLGDRVRRDGTQLRRIDDPDASALHLLEEDPALHRPHEENDLDGPDIGTRGDHVHSDGNPGVVAVPELLDQVGRLLPGRFVRDLLAEGVTASELIAKDLDDIFSVGVVLGEDDRFRDLPPAREEFREELLLERLDDEPDLIACDDGPVEVIP